MVECVKYFDGKNYCGKILKASERRPKRHPSVPAPKQRLTLVQNYTETITISNSKYLKAQLEKKIELLNQTFSDTNVLLVSEENFDLKCKVDSTNSSNFDKVIKIVKSWKIFYRAYYLHNTTSNINQMKSEILNKFSESSLDIHVKPDKVSVRCFNSNLCDEVFNKIETFISNKIDIVEKINIDEDSELELIRLATKDKRFLKEKNLLNFGFDCRGHEVVVTGKKASFDKINVQKILETFKLKEKFSLTDKRILKHAIYKLNSFHHELKKKFIILNFSQKLSQNDIFEMFGFKFDEDQMEQESEKIKHYLLNVRSIAINLRSRESIDLNKIKSQLNDFTKKNTLNEGNDDDNDVYLHEQSKIIFINGTDEEEINQLKESILKLIKGSREITKIIPLKNRIYANNVHEESLVFTNLRNQFKNMKIFIDCKKSLTIRITGSEADVISTELKINEFLNSFANQIVTKRLELKKSEFKYLQSQRDKIDEMKKSTKILIDTSLMRKYISVCLNSTEIEILEGNLITIPADAYVSPANKELNNNGGVAHSIIEKAGKHIQKECDQYVKKKN
jgi:hypothetical protein